MRLRKLCLRNIRSYESLELDFPDGSVLLSGDVGSGKTTILLAIEYALFGLQPGQKGSALLRNTSDYGEVSLELEVGGKEVLIERKIKRGSKSVTNDSATITIDGKRFENSITEVKVKILHLLDYPSEFIKKNNILYRYTVYTPQEQMKQIILEDSETRLNILRHVFGIDKYKRIRDNLSIIISKFKDESKILQIETSDIEKHSSKRLILHSSINLLESKIQELVSQLENVVLKRKEKESETLAIEEKSKDKFRLESEEEKTKIIYSSKKETIQNIIKEQNEAQELISSFKDKFKESELLYILSNLDEKRQELEKYNQSYINSLSNLNSFRKSIKELKEDKERVFNIEFCSVCLQNVSESHKHNILHSAEGKIIGINENILKCEEEIVFFQKCIKNTKLNISELEEKKSNLSIIKSREEFINRSIKKFDELSKSKENLEKDLVILTNHIDNLKAQISHLSVFDTKLRIKKEELKKAFSEEKNVEISLAESKRELSLLKSQLQELDLSISKKEEIKKKLLHLLELIDWLSNQLKELVDFLERTILLKLRKEFSKVFRNWFITLAGDSFEIQLDENFTPIILQGDIEMEYSFLSGGERTAVALAYRLALNQTINSVLSTIKTRDLIILDEPTDGFSDAQIEKMRDILQELKVAQLVLVSHEQKIEGFVDSVIRLRKEGTSSSISEGLNVPILETENQKT